MSDHVIIDGDQAIFLPAFGNAIVVVQPGRMQGSGPATLRGKKLCVDGDEKNVEVPGCTYIAPPYVTPGTGTLKIAALAGNQVATTTNTGGTAVILKGQQFTAKFEVQAPAMQPSAPPVPDSTPQYTGNGMFITTNATFMAS